MRNIKTAQIRCDDNSEAVCFHVYSWDDGDTWYEINVEDSYCNGDYVGIKGRFKRAWHAFWAKPICYSGICVTNGERVRYFLNECLSLVDSNK